MLDVIAKRAERRMTGAAWQRRALGELEERLDRAEAIAAMFAQYRIEARRRVAGGVVGEPRSRRARFSRAVISTEAVRRRRPRTAIARTL